MLVPATILGILAVDLRGVETGRPIRTVAGGGSLTGVRRIAWLQQLGPARRQLAPQFAVGLVHLDPRRGGIPRRGHEPTRAGATMTRSIQMPVSRTALADDAEPDTVTSAAIAIQMER